MNVYIITKEPFPHGMAATNRVICYAKGCMAYGLDCTVLIAKRTEYKNNIILNAQADGIYENIKYKYIGNTTIRSSFLIKRKIVDFLDYTKLLFFSLFNIKKDDVILSVFMSLLLRFYVIVIGNLKKTKNVFDLCEYPYAPGKDTFLKKIKQWIEIHYFFRFFDGIVSISEELTNFAKKYKSKHAQILKVPIMIDLNKNKYSQSYNSDVPYIFHAGSLTEKKDAILSTLTAFSTAIKTIDSPIKFIIASEDYSSWAQIQKLIKEHKLEDSVLFLGKLKNEDVFPYWKGASLAILNKHDNVQNRYGFSTKLAEILLSETAVITTTVGEANYYLKDGESAYIVPPHRSELIADKIIQAFTYEEERKRIAKNGKEIAMKEFDCIYQGKRMFDFYKLL